jgi:molybdenum cofactor guanylyltransferase
MELIAQHSSSLLAVVLAGGQSSRMGQDKAKRYAPRFKTTLLAHCMNLLSQLDGVQVIVSGDNHVNGIADIHPQRGPLSGIQAALRQVTVESAIKELLFVPVDMPNLSISLLKDLISFGRKQHSAAYLNHCYLPCYLPITPELYWVVTKQIEQSQDFSIRTLMVQLNGQSLMRELDEELLNVNDQDSWDSHCV